MHVLRKYANRKLYDVTDHRYVNLAEVAAMVRRGDDVLVRRSASGEDITSVILAEVVGEEEKKNPRVAPEVLVRLIREGSAAWPSGFGT